MATLKLGSKGDEVRKLQVALGLSADGNFGPKTKEAVIAFQKKNKLVADGIVGPVTLQKIFSSSTTEKPKETESKSDIVIEQKPINVHITTSKGRDIKYLVIHYTAGSSSASGKALQNRNVFLTREASADFIVDDETIMQVNANPKDSYCWAVGDKGDGRKKTITNKQCISIEMCSSLEKGTSAAKPNHEGWYFTDKVIDNTVKLAKHLMSLYNIPLDNVIRHYDVTGKMCPGVLGWNKGTVYDAKTGNATGKKNTEEKWFEFKDKLSK